MTVFPNPIAELDPDTSYYPIPKVRTDYTLPIKAKKSTINTNSANLVSSVGTWTSPPTNLNLMNDGDFDTVAYGGQKQLLTKTGYLLFDYNQIQNVTSVHYKFREQNDFEQTSSTMHLLYSEDNVVFTEFASFVFAGNLETKEATVPLGANMRYIKAIFDPCNNCQFAPSIFVHEITIESQGAPLTHDGNLTTFESEIGINKWFQHEMSALADKRPLGFYIYLKNTTTMTKSKLQLSTDEIIWDDVRVLNIGSDIILEQDNFIEINKPIKNYRFYRLVSDNSDSRILDTAEMRYIEATDFEERHGHKKFS